jgi:hypothetical protein
MKKFYGYFIQENQSHYKGETSETFASAEKS